MPREPPPGGSHGGAHGHLPLPGAGPDQEEVGDVDAGEDEEGSHGELEEDQGESIVPNEGGPERRQAAVRPGPCAELGVTLLKAGPHRVQLGLSPLRGDAVGETDHGLGPSDRPVRGSRPKLHRHPELDGLALRGEAREVPGQDADDLVGRTVDPDPPAEDVTGTPEPSRPESAADHRRGRGPGLGVGRSEAPSQEGLHAQHRKEVGRGLGAGHLHGVLAPGHREGSGVEAGDLPDRGLGLHQPQRHVGGGPDPASSDLGYGDEALRVRKREGGEQHAPNDAEHDAVGSDPQGQRDDHHGGEPRSAGEGAERGPRVPGEVPPLEAPHVRGSPVPVSLVFHLPPPGGRPWRPDRSRAPVDPRRPGLDDRAPCRVHDEGEGSSPGPTTDPRPSAPNHVHHLLAMGPAQGGGVEAKEETVRPDHPGVLAHLVTPSSEGPIPGEIEKRLLATGLGAQRFEPQLRQAVRLTIRASRSRIRAGLDPLDQTLVPQPMDQPVEGARVEAEAAPGALLEDPQEVVAVAGSLSEEEEGQVDPGLQGEELTGAGALARHRSPPRWAIRGPGDDGRPECMRFALYAQCTY